MTDREKLIDLIKKGANGHTLMPTRRIANYLLAHGVTFATDTNDGCKWISVKDRLPEDGVQVLACTKHGKAFSAHCEKGKWRVSHSVTVTHWMPLPEPPKED